ncbi:IS200/IS605 family transposase [Salegentibacter sediminis]|uniref:IS200/IS605 family transposase n=1 Tax=Salegentibacter sediminis TaxID=1930251 RepID=UPI0009BDD173|nr:IS200/IS605 family transposase [Salegentibacter sediminis]
MSHSFNKIWIHAIWATKERMPLLEPEIEDQVYYIMKDEFKFLGCPVRIINGMPDHVHRLFLLNPERSIAEVIKHIKGNSSYYINQSDLIPQKFAWQTGYAAFSVSESGVEKVFHYIRNQKAQHQKKAFNQEYEEFLKLNKLEKE